MLPTRDEFMTAFAYDPETGIFTRRANGAAVGRKDYNGYRRISLYGKVVYAHRLAWLFIHAEWPPKWIDHKDGNRANNSISNLRSATPSQNIAAASHSFRKPKSGFRGVHWKQRNKKWASYIRHEGKAVHLGYYSGVSEAAKAYDLAAIRLFGEFAYRNLPV